MSFLATFSIQIVGINQVWDFASKNHIGKERQGS